MDGIIVRSCVSSLFANGSLQAIKKLLKIYQWFASFKVRSLYMYFPKNYIFPIKGEIDLKYGHVFQHCSSDQKKKSLKQIIWY